MEQFFCNECQKAFKDYSTLRKHNSMVHKIKSEDTYILIKCNGVRPTCECGCGQNTKFLGDNTGFRKFLSGHNSATSANNFHKNPESKIKSAKTQSENWKKGMYRRWWDEDTDETRSKIEGIKEKLHNDVERGKKISKALSGIPKSEEAKRKNSETNIQRYKNNPILLQNARVRRINWLKRKQKKKTNLEYKFDDILNSLGLLEDIDFITQYDFNYRLFDYFLIKWNILIETDGDFYHCNPQKYELKYKVQEITIRNDEYKNDLCKRLNQPLYRFWEQDINERPEWVLERLKEILDIHDS